MRHRYKRPKSTTPWKTEKWISCWLLRPAGGQLELKEKIEDAIKRELYEETGLKANSLSYLGVVRELQETYNYIHFVFTCQEFEGKPTLCEPEKCEGWEWHSIDVLPSPLLPGHQAALSLYSHQSASIIDLI